MDFASIEKFGDSLRVHRHGVEVNYLIESNLGYALFDPDGVGQYRYWIFVYNQGLQRSPIVYSTIDPNKATP